MPKKKQKYQTRRREEFEETYVKHKGHKEVPKDTKKYYGFSL